jgi:5-formyltetrahydrofolate cyclo-ligase
MEKPKKSDIRKSILKKRDALTPIERSRDSAIIRQRIFQTPEWNDAHTVLIYASYKSEVDTTKLIKTALENGKRVVLPVIDERDHQIRISELKSFGDLAPGHFHGIHEPAKHLQKLIDPSEVELAVVPGIAFDRKGGRIGFGGGFFDKLLARMPRARRMGLAYSLQLRTRGLPKESHDVAMHIVVTEKELVKVG